MPPAQGWTGQTQDFLSLPDRQTLPLTPPEGPAQPGPCMLPQGPEVNTGSPGPMEVAAPSSRAFTKGERASAVWPKRSGLQPCSPDSACHTEGQQGQIRQHESTLTHASAQLIFFPTCRTIWADLGGGLCQPAAPTLPGVSPPPHHCHATMPPHKGLGRRGMALGWSGSSPPEPPGRPGQGSDTSQFPKHLLLPWPLSLTPDGSGGRGSPACWGPLLSVPRMAPTTWHQGEPWWALLCMGKKCQSLQGPHFPLFHLEKGRTSLFSLPYSSWGGEEWKEEEDLRPAALWGSTLSRRGCTPTPTPTSSFQMPQVSFILTLPRQNRLQSPHPHGTLARPPVPWGGAAAALFTVL